MSEQYVDKTGTMDKPNPMRDVYLEFPEAMFDIAEVTAYGAKKHAPRGWTTFDHAYALEYHMSKIGRHLLDNEVKGPVNPDDGDCLHMAAVAWNALAWICHYRRQEAGQAPLGKKIAEILNEPNPVTGL